MAGEKLYFYIAADIYENGKLISKAYWSFECLAEEITENKWWIEALKRTLCAKDNIPDSQEIYITNISRVV